MVSIDQLFVLIVKFSAFAFVLLAAGVVVLRLFRQPVERVHLIQVSLASVFLATWVGHSSWLPSMELAWLPGEQQLDTAGHASGPNTREAASTGIDREVGDSKPEADKAPLEQSNHISTNAATYLPYESHENVASTPLIQLAPWRIAKSTIVIGFVVISSVQAVYFLFGYFLTVRLVASATPLELSDPKVIDNFRTELAENRVRLAMSERISIPIASGILLPTIVLPKQLLRGNVDAVRIRHSLDHEWKHIERKDLITWQLASVCQILLWPQPFYWMLRRELRFSQDQIADQFATRQEEEQVAYATTLVEFSKASHSALLGALSMTGNKSNLYRRVEMLLNTEFKVAGFSRKRVVLGFASLMAAASCLLPSLQLTHATESSNPDARSTDQAAASNVGKANETVIDKDQPTEPVEHSGFVFDALNEKPVANATVTKPENKTGQFGAALSGKATDQDGGRFHLVRGSTTWLGSDGAPIVYDEYDKNCYISRGAHTVVLPRHTEGFFDFYRQRTLQPGVGRMDVSRVHPASEQPANITMPGAIDLPTYQLLLQPSVQQALNLSEEQRTKLRDISAKYWPERRQIAGKELDDMESTKQAELAVYIAKAGHGVVQSGQIGSSSPFSKEVVEKLERQWSSARKQIEDVLTPEQLRTLKDLTFRTFAFGSGVMFEPEVLGRLGVAKHQQDELRALELQLQKEKDRRLRSVPREKIKKMLAVLTPQQQSQLREKHSLDKNPETDCSMYPYPGLPSHMPDTGAAEELGFSAEQRERVRKIVTAHWMSLIALQQEEQKLPLGDEKAFKAIGEKRRQEMADLRKQIEAALTPEQWASCREMAFQNLAMPTLRRVASIAQLPNKTGLTERLGMAVYIAKESVEMGLTEQQRAALREIDAEYVDKPEQIYCELTDKALAAFTPAQQEQLRAEVDRRGW